MASSLEGNKIFAAILTAGIIGVGSSVLSEMFYHPEEIEEAAYRVAIEDETAEVAEQAVQSEPIGVLLASADVANGEKVAKKCGACHSFEKGGANKVGPALWNVVNRAIGAGAGFAYSNAFASHGGTWDFDALDGFLANPKEWVPGTKMNFAGLKKGGDRADLIAYMRGLSDNPVPLPEG